MVLTIPKDQFTSKLKRQPNTFQKVCKHPQRFMILLFEQPCATDDALYFKLYKKKYYLFQKCIFPCQVDQVL